uniref:Matrix metallopeptidase 9 (Gelatinase B, 92kDa gelatinase, 92kDa type IV collagenase) [Ceratotherium simum simum] n=1 Tax=Lepeophtheirus salmonis TaxID=72036 RepID=A0A0K2UFQ3_LEPSM
MLMLTEIVVLTVKVIINNKFYFYLSLKYIIIHNQSGASTPSLSGCQASTGKACVFPFVYSGTTYNECTVIDNNGVKWCATSVGAGLNYVGYGNCIESTCKGCVATNGKKCVFPFKYKGDTYSKCTTADNGGVPWCANTVFSNQEANDYGICPSDCASEPTPAPNQCQTLTGKLCVFPFMYNGQSYTNCTSVDNGGIKWCATSVDSNSNYLGFGNCIESKC